LRSRRNTYPILVCLRVYILRDGCIVLVRPGCSAATEQGQTRLDMGVCGIQFGCSGVRIQGV
jgi:hypothetical protein